MSAAPKAMRNTFRASPLLENEEAGGTAPAAYGIAADAQEQPIAGQTDRLTRAQAVLIVAGYRAGRLPESVRARHI